MTHPTLMTLGGRAVDSDIHTDVINPALGRAFASAPAATREHVEQAVVSAHAAFASWRVRPARERQQLLIACAQALLAEQESLARLLTLEQGKPIRAARYEVEQTALWFRHYGSIALDDKPVSDPEACCVSITRQPLGVIAAITPWNFPLLLAAMKLAPALVTGNTVVLKPSPFTPLATLAMGQLLSTVLPPDVLNVISGDNEIGSEMTRHPLVRKISFTGSVATGKRVAGAAADDLKRVTLELGGNDAAIVLDDADPARLARGLLWGAFTNGGQICAGIKRVYVPDALHDALIEHLSTAANRIRVGPGLDETVQMGPIATRPQFERVQELRQDAIDAGARVESGAAIPDGDGYFLPPTILSGVHEGMRVVDEEQFGPLLPVLRYARLDEAIERANASMYGLSASVWSSDTARAQAVAQQLDCGSVYLNTHLVIKPGLPFGGVKWSGVGVENGEWVLDEYTHPKVVYGVNA